MKTYQVQLHAHLIYQFAIKAESPEDALAEADAEAAERGETYLKSGELIEAWIDDAELVPMKTARVLQYTSRESGEVGLYRLSEPLNGYLYVQVSAVNHGRPETYIFGADADGNRVSSELPGSFRGALDHAKALEDAGYLIEAGESE